MVNEETGEAVSVALKLWAVVQAPNTRAGWALALSRASPAKRLLCGSRRRMPARARFAAFHPICWGDEREFHLP